MLCAHAHSCNAIAKQAGNILLSLYLIGLNDIKATAPKLFTGTEGPLVS